MTRVAAIDCGTNTIRLLIIDSEGVEYARESIVVRLGQGVDRTGELATDALERTFAAIETYADLIRTHGATKVRFVATSATRDARNAAEFVAGVEARLGVVPDVVSGDEEAALAFAGATASLGAEIARPVLVFDVGGGSTELIRGAADRDEVRGAYSMQIGSVRLTERHFREDPPSMEEISAVVRDIDDALDQCPIDPSRPLTVIGVAGTVIQVAIGALGLTAYDRSLVDQARVPIAAMQKTVEQLLAMTVDERLALPWMHPGRADVIAAGGLIVSRILRRVSVDELVVSESDILDGIAQSLLD